MTCRPRQIDSTSWIQETLTTAVTIFLYGGWTMIHNPHLHLPDDRFKPRFSPVHRSRVTCELLCLCHWLDLGGHQATRAAQRTASP